MDTFPVSPKIAPQLRPSRSISLRSVVASLQQEIERQDRELESVETIAKASDPDVRFRIGAEFDERIGALLDQMNVRPAIREMRPAFGGSALAPVRGIRV